jgi:S-DNA-T family DNA segregation ATPase FtsK/SpoIIIE
MYLIAPLIMAAATFALYYFFMPGGSRQTDWIFMVVGTVLMSVIYSVVSFGAYLFQIRKYKKQLREREEKYRQQLQKHRLDLLEKRKLLQAALHKLNPPPAVCMKKIVERDSSLWERSPHDPDFLHVRLGTGTIPSTVEVLPPDQEGYDKDPLITEAQQLAREFADVPDVPVLLPLAWARVTGIVGDRKTALGTIRSLVIQLVAHHSPDEVKLVSFYGDQEAAQWSWMRWLPHVWDDRRTVRYMATDKHEARRPLDDLYGQFSRRAQRSETKDTKLPFYVFIVSNSRLVEDEAIWPLLLGEADSVGATVILLAESKKDLPRQCRVIVEVRKDRMGLLYSGPHPQPFHPDDVSVGQADKTARSLAAIRLKSYGVQEIPSVLPLFDLLDVNSVEELDVIGNWSRNRFPHTLPASIGMGNAGKKMVLNLHDKIERMGHGPHGLIAGTTGSGKSEVIQTIIASLAVRYHPHDVVFLLIDYKGGGMSNTFERLPHLVGSITNLDGNLIERAKVSLRAELMRRERLLKEAGNLQHIDEYYRSPWRETKPLPHLMIIVDEFAELKKEHPEFMDELISIAAKGRTLGVHLILATQKPGGVVNDKIWSNSRFRICLRVQDEADSREVIKIPDAAWITTPGRGYIQVGSNELLEMVQFAWSGAPYRPDSKETPIAVREVKLNGQRVSRNRKGLISPSVGEDHGPKQLHVLIDHLCKQAERMGIKSLAGPWLNPLPEEMYLEDILGEREEGWNGTCWRPAVGIVDDPANQRQELLRIPLEEGHLAVYGMPGTGKTTFVQTLLLSLALDHSPEQLHMYILDFGRMFKDFEKLPHVGGVISDHEPDRVYRLFRFLIQELQRRREKIVQAGAKTLSAYRKFAHEPIPAIVVVIDGYLTFRNMFEEENHQLGQLLREGGSVGIHVAVTAHQISDIYESTRSNFSIGVSFELGDPRDYYFVVGRLGTPRPRLPKGRGFVRGSGPLEFQTALPAKGSDEIGRTRELSRRIEAMDASWKGSRPKTIEALPKAVYLEELLSRHSMPDGGHPARMSVPVAISREDLSPFGVALQDGPYFMVGSPRGKGKTSFLQSWILSLAYFTSPERLEIYMIDFSPSHAGLSALQGLPHIQGYASNLEELAELLPKIKERLEERSCVGLPQWGRHPDGQREEEQPALFLVIDDAEFFYKKLDSQFDLKQMLNDIVSQGRKKNFYMAISFVPADLPYCSNDWLAEVKGMETGFVFATLESADLSVFRIPSTVSNVYASAGRPRVLDHGEGYFSKRTYAKIKGVLPFSTDSSAADWIRKINHRWLSVENWK